MPRDAIIDLTLDDDEEAVDLIRRRDDPPPRLRAQRDIGRETLRRHPRLTANAVRRPGQAPIDLTAEGTSASHAPVPGRPGSANEAGSRLSNDLQPDSRSQNQNTTARTPGMTTGASSTPRAQISGDTGQSRVEPTLTRVSAKTAPATLNSEHPRMFSGPGNPYGRRPLPLVSAAPNPRPPPPPQDGFTLASPQIISSSDEDDDTSDGGRDEDLQIVEERSTPAHPNRQANCPTSRQEHVSVQPPAEQRQDSAREVGREIGPSGNAERDRSALELEDQPAQLMGLTPEERYVAHSVRRFWRVFPWEVTTRNPPQFDGKLVQGFHNFALAGCSLERAKQLIEDQINRRIAISPQSPNYVVPGDIDDARSLFLDRRIEKTRGPTGPSTSLQGQRSQDNSIVGTHLPSPLHHTPAQSLSAPVQPMAPPAAEDYGNPFEPSAIFSEKYRPVMMEFKGSGLPVLIHHTPRKEPPRPAPPSVDELAEQAGATTSAQPKQDVNKAEPVQNTDSAPKPGQTTVTIVDQGNASQSNPKTDASQVGPVPRDLTSGVHGYQGGTTSYSITEVENLLKKRLKRLQDDREHFTSSRLGRARRSHRSFDENQTGESATDFISGPSMVPKQFQQIAFPWPNAKPIQARGAVKSGGTNIMVQRSQEVFPQGSKGIRSIMCNTVDSYATDAVPVPPYTSYVSLKQNVLAENHKTLMIYPYFDDYQDEDATKKSLWDELRSRYNIVADELRRRRLLQAEQAWQLRSYAEESLQALHCPMKDILRYFLLSPDELEQCLGSQMKAYEAKYLQERREESCKEEFNRERKRWRRVLEDLPESLPGKIAFAAVFCPAWLSVFGFSFWHIVRRTPLAQSQTITVSSRLPNTENSSKFAYRDLACRVCHVHNCPFHGAILEQPDMSDHPDSDEDSESDEESSEEVARTSKDPKPANSRRSSVSSVDSLVNYKRLVNAQPREHPDDDGNVQPVRRDAKFWAARSKTHLMERRPPFFPCSHKGTCSDARCSCFKNGITCEKTCACAASCKRRYRGCTCAQEGTICWKSKKCDCWKLNRECDPDLCASCGAAEVLDPVNRYNDAATRGKCCNVNIQRNVPKRTLLGESEVQGFGLYMGERANSGDYIGEYKGEVVMKEEGSRRGAVYQHLKTNYLFNLNRAQEVDSTRAGNKLRFINNSARAPNCEPRVMLCNTVVRIGMFAIKDIKAGEELFFNYNYPHDVTKHFWEKGETKTSGTAYAVKSKKGGKQKARIANSSVSSDSEIVSKRTNGKAARQKTTAARRSRLGQSTVKGSSTINQLAWATSGKRPRQGAREKQQNLADLNEYLDNGGTKEQQGDSEVSEAEIGEEEESEEDDLVEYPESEEDERPKKRTRRGKI